MDWLPLLLSLQVACAATAIAGALGVSIAGLMATRRFPGRELLDVLLTTPMVLPPTVLGYYVLTALGRRSVLGQFYEAVSGSTLVFTRTGAVIAATLGALPLILKASRAALEAVDPLLLDAAHTLGAGGLRVFYSVHLPLALRGITAGLTLGFARALGDFGVTLMVAGDIPGETQTAALAIYDAIAANDHPRALGMILVLSAVAVAALYAVNRLTASRDRRER